MTYPHLLVRYRMHSKSVGSEADLRLMGEAIDRAADNAISASPGQFLMLSSEIGDYDDWLVLQAVLMTAAGRVVLRENGDEDAHHPALIVCPVLDAALGDAQGTVADSLLLSLRVIIERGPAVGVHLVAGTDSDAERLDIPDWAREHMSVVSVEEQPHETMLEHAIFEILRNSAWANNERRSM